MFVQIGNFDWCFKQIIYSPKPNVSSIYTKAKLSFNLIPHRRNSRLLISIISKTWSSLIAKELVNNRAKWENTLSIKRKILRITFVIILMHFVKNVQMVSRKKSYLPFLVVLSLAQWILWVTYHRMRRTEGCSQLSLYIPRKTKYIFQDFACSLDEFYLWKSKVWLP